MFLDTTWRQNLIVPSEKHCLFQKTRQKPIWTKITKHWVWNCYYTQSSSHSFKFLPKYISVQIDTLTHVILIHTVFRHLPIFFVGFLVGSSSVLTVYWVVEVVGPGVGFTGQLNEVNGAVVDLAVVLFCDSSGAQHTLKTIFMLFVEHRPPIRRWRSSLDDVAVIFLHVINKKNRAYNVFLSVLEQIRMGH